jgi:hypothetical protein
LLQLLNDADVNQKSDSRTSRREAAALGVYEVADVVIGEVVARRFGHRDVVQRTTDNECP